MHIESIPEERAGRAGQALRTLHLLYHEVRLCRSDYLYAIEREQFERQADLFVELRKAGSGCLWPELTFDDGHISNFEYAMPVLASRDLTARFFITVGWTGKRPGYMGWEELRALQQSGNTIGAHGWSHTLLTHCDKKDLNKELRVARMMLEDKLGTSITTMSLPGGRCNREVLAACREAGYSRIYTSMPSAEQMPLGDMVGRMNIRGDMTLEWIESVLQPGSRALSGMGRQYRMKEAAKRLLGDGLYERLWAVLNRKERGAVEGGEGAE